jgi:uncharacterized protein YndB with AHSA1/START domain
MKVKETIFIRRPVEDVFNFVSDPSNDTTWRSGVVECVVQSGGPIEVGTTGSNRERLMGREVVIEWRITEYVHPERMAWEFIGGPLQSRGNYTFKDMGNLVGTTLTVNLEPAALGLAGLLMPGMVPGLRRVWHEGFGRLKRTLEAQL